MKDFPNNSDIERLVKMAEGDYGFFVLAAYSFIEKYMKSAISFSSKDDGSDGTFSEIIYRYIGFLHKKMFVTDADHKFLWSMKNGKQNANTVRHQFASLSLEEALCAVQDLLHFFTIADNDVKNHFKNLEERLSEWQKREAPQTDSAKELMEAKCRLEEFQNSLPTMILESDEYKKLQTQLEQLKSKCIELESQNVQSKEAAQKLEEQVAEYQSAESALNERFGEYEEYIKNLKRLLTYTRTRNDFEHSILRLSPEQQDAADRIKFKKDYLVKGPAGTGKSLVLLKSIENLLEQNKDGAKPKIIFVTYTNSLVKYNSYIAKLMNMGIEEENIKTADSFFNEIMNTVLPGHYTTFTNCEKEIGEIIKKKYKGTDLSKSAVNNEAQTFIWPNMITKEEYLDQMIFRTGLREALKKPQRELYWDVIQTLEEELSEKKNWNADFAKLKVAGALKEKPLSDEEKFADYIFVDEGQDLSIASMFCLKAVCRTSVVIAADNDQMIYQVQTPIKRSGIDIAGNSITLKTNFRNTIQINDCAERYRKLIKGCNSDYTSSSFRMGPPVELMEIDSSLPKDDFLKIAAKRTKMFIEELNYAPENICLIMTGSTINNRLQKLRDELSAQGIDSEFIKEKEFDQSGKVCVSTIHSVKGLDFPVVILLAEHRFHLNDGKFSDDMLERMQRNLLYVAMTRAMDMLTVMTWSSVENDVIGDLKKCCR